MNLQQTSGQNGYTFIGSVAPNQTNFTKCACSTGNNLADLMYGANGTMGYVRPGQSFTCDNIDGQLSCYIHPTQQMLPIQSMQPWSSGSIPQQYVATIPEQSASLGAAKREGFCQKCAKI